MGHQPWVRHCAGGCKYKNVRGQVLAAKADTLVGKADVKEMITMVIDAVVPHQGRTEGLRKHVTGAANLVPGLREGFFEIVTLRWI